MVSKKGLFLDLDGTIITTVSGDKFPKDVNDWKFNGRILEVLEIFAKKGFRICIVTNQGGIEKGLVRESEINIKLEKIANEIEKVTNFKPFYRFSLYVEENFSRKPDPGMAYACALKLELSLLRSLMIGSKDSDRSFAAFSGIGTYFDINDFLKIEEEDIDVVMKHIDDLTNTRFIDINFNNGRHGN